MKTTKEKLAQVYVDLNPHEFESQPPDMADIARIVGNWMDRLKATPAKAIALSNWYGKVTRAFLVANGIDCFAAINGKILKPSTKGEILLIIMPLIAEAPENAEALKTIEHAPGPWFLTGVYCICQNGDSALPICEMSEPTSASPQAKANARLIAAAPELLAALEPFTILNPTKFPEYAGSIEIARATVAKAKGRA